MTDRILNKKATNKENNRNDISRPDNEKGNKKAALKYTNFEGKPVK